MKTRQGDKETRRQGAGRSIACASPCLRGIALSVAVVSVWLTNQRGAAGAEPWVDTRQVGPFVCQATFALDELAPFFAELETLDRDLMRTLGIEPASQPIYIYLFSNLSSHREYVTKHYPDIPYRRALFVQEGSRAGVYAYRHEELEIDIRHECTHALLHASLPVVPLWLDEGVAEYFEVPASQRAFDHPHFATLRWNMRLGLVRDIASLEQSKNIDEMGAVEYRYAWAWVHFMLHGPESAHQTLASYLADIRRGVPVGSLSERFAETTPDTTERMVQHFKHWRR
jgi:hypothetical protein